MSSSTTALVLCDPNRSSRRVSMTFCHQQLSFEREPDVVSFSAHGRSFLSGLLPQSGALHWEIHGGMEQHRRPIKLFSRVVMSL